MYKLQQASGLGLNKVDRCGAGQHTTWWLVLLIGAQVAVAGQINARRRPELLVRLIRGVMPLAVLFSIMFV